MHEPFPVLSGLRLQIDGLNLPVFGNLLLKPGHTVQPVYAHRQNHDGRKDKHTAPVPDRKHHGCQQVGQHGCQRIGNRHIAACFFPFIRRHLFRKNTCHRRPQHRLEYTVQRPQHQHNGILSGNAHQQVQQARANQADKNHLFRADFVANQSAENLAHTIYNKQSRTNQPRLCFIHTAVCNQCYHHRGIAQPSEQCHHIGHGTQPEQPVGQCMRAYTTFDYLGHFLHTPIRFDSLKTIPSISFTRKTCNAHSL